MNYEYGFLSNNHLPTAIQDYFIYMETIKNKSSNTIAAYRKDLTIFCRFMLIHKGVVDPKKVKFDEIDISNIENDFFREIKLRDLYAFLSYVEKYRHNGIYARGRKVSCLKAFFKYLSSKAKIINENPAADLEYPKVNKRHPVFLTLDQCLVVLDSLDKKNKNYYRDYCILTLFLNCGVRLSELCGIQISKIKDDTLTIIGKGNKERTVYLNESCLIAIEKYLSVRDISKVDPEYRDYLFISNKNKPISGRNVEILVKKHINNAGFTDKNYSPHKLRHSAATLMFKYGNVDIRTLQDILGHENISTTQIYTHVDDEGLRAAINSNPLANIAREE